MIDLSKNVIALVELVFDDGSGSKKRPAYLLKKDSDSLFVFKITTKFANKSPQMKEHYFEIIDTVYAGLNSKSWIDTYEIRTIPVSGNLKVYLLGMLSDNDFNRFEKYMLSK